MTYGIVHLHSEHSLKDGAQSIHDMVARAKEMGAKAITLTDHGTCTGWVNFLKETEDAGIKGILGVEAYVRDDICDTRRHLILLAKNKQGYQELSHAVTESNKNIESTKVGNKEFNFPMMNFELLKKCFGNGNVIATSACVTGVLSSILLKDHYRRKNIEKLRKKQSKYESPDTDSEYHALLKAKESIEETVEELKTLKNEKTKLANKKYKRRRLNLKYIENEEEKEKELLQIEKEEEESLCAKEELPSIQTRIKNEKKQITALNKDIRKKENSFTRYSDFEEEIKTIEGTLQGEEALLKETEEELFRYLSLFGKDFYIEIQYHGMPEEEYVFTRLISLARKHRVPLVAANDAHITYPSQTDKREFMRSLQFIRWEPSSDYDKELYMKTDEELSAFLEKVYIKEAVEAAMRNIKKLCDSCEPIHILHEKHYPTYRENGEIIKNSKKLLLEKVRQGAKEKFPEGLPQEYKDRVNHEFKTICDMGFADYHLIVADYLNYGRMLGKTNTKEKCGYAIGPARGSAAGSLLCYLIGITSINPMPYDLLFERFLNPERVSMPDIDADFSDEVRDACIDYVTQKYGRESVACIRTTMTMAARSSVRNAGKIISSKHYGDKMALDKLTDSMAKSIPSRPKIKLSSPLDEGASLTVEENLCQEYNTPEAREIVELAKKAEGSIINLGIHAAGIIIGNEEPLDHFIPLLYSDKKGWATQCDMIEAEEIGLLKMDFLGLKNLDVLTDAIRMIKRNHGVSIDLDNLPQEPEIYREIFAKGFTNSIFQFESSGMKDVLQRFQPDCFEDIILIVALYRPGPMQFIPDVIDVKHHRKAPSYGTPLLEPILGKTYGSIIYQEQVMLIFQNLAGYSLGFADLVRRAMSKKHFDEIERERNSFLYGDPDRNIKGCIANGIDKDTANTLFDQMTEFAKYAFNKSHAAAYSMISYQTAYLKYHYPVEYMASVMTHEKNEKMNALIYDCKQMGIQVLPIDVNRSYSSFVPENGNIRYGLSMMKNMGNNGDKIVEERLKNGPYQSVQDFIERTDVSKSVLESLALSGGFDSFIGNHRLAWASSMADLKQMIKDQKKKESQYAEKPNDLLKETITLSKNSIQYFGTSFPEDAELEALNREHEFLGAYVSKHPLESYRAVYQHTMTIDGFKEGYHQLAGLITNLRFVKKKADGASMAFFTLEDISGSIEVCVFPKVFHQLKPFLKEGNIVYVKGKCIIEREEREDDEPIENYKIFANEMSECVAFQENILLSIDNRSVMKDNIDLQNYIKHFFHSDNGIPFIIFNKETGEAKRSPSLLSKDILKTPIPYKGITGVLQKINP